MAGAADGRRMTRDRVEDTTRVVVDGEHHGGVLPGNRAEIWRDVYLLPGADVAGPVWADRVEVRGPGVAVGESVYARGGIRLRREDAEAHGDGAVTFGSTVTTPESLVARDVDFRTRFRSNLYADTVHLEKCVVYGNVYAERAVLRDCVVLGGVYSEGALSVSRSVLATFDVGAAEVRGPLSLLFPVAIASEPFTLEAPVRVLCFFDLEELLAGVEDVRGGTVVLDAGDVHRIELPRRSGGNDRERVHALSLNHRILDTHDLEETFRTNRRVLEEVALADHLPRARRRAAMEDEVSSIERGLLDLAAAPELPRVEGSSGLEEIARRPEIRETLELLRGAPRAGSRGGTSRGGGDEGPDGD